MSDIKIISPLLENFDVGGSISEHNGVRCYPAMRKGSDEKYIIKTISIPASQTQLDALLLTGAYGRQEDALAYFKELAENTVSEFKLLQRLAQLDGFLPGEECQIAELDDRTGYCVYMLTPYSRTLTKHLQRHPATHLSAVNLGLDLCAALSACRQSGYLYVDLKPSNVYVTEDKRFLIGDLGFIPFSSLKYASLPSRYQSAYTAPEITDAFAPLNKTLDIYALGVILYQVYNDGRMPEFAEDGKTFVAPQYADDEISEIILKACNPDPELRWQDPVEMGQALVSYMQRNGVNDVPIITAIPQTDVPPVQELVCEAEIVEDDAVAEHEDCTTSPENIELNEHDDVVDCEELDLADDVVEPSVLETSIALEQELPSADVASEPAVVTTDIPETDYENLSFLDEMLADEALHESSEDVLYDEMSEDISEMLCHIDELTSHPVPDPVVAPDPVEIQIPEPIVIDEEQPEEETDLISAESSIDDTVVDTAFSTDIDKEDTPDFAPSFNDLGKQKKSNNILRNIIILLLVAIIGVAGYLYYSYVYLLNIDSVSVDGNEVSMVVNVNSQVDESLLSVVCSDSHGNQLSAPVVDGKATFANLAPDTAYNIKILVEGFHRLTGDVSASYSTPALTNVVQFNAVTGPENGSVILGFTVEGPDSGLWNVVYAAEGEEEKQVELLSHMTTLTGLTVGKEYTFTLVPSDGMYVTGMTQIQFTASDLIFAENLSILSLVDNKLTVSWEAPKGVEVSNWTVRCYDNDTYNETIITTETLISFDGIDPSNSFTVEVTAAGMSVSERAYVAENAITITDFTVDTSNAKHLTLNWKSSQDIPEGGWILLYSIDGSETQGSITTDKNHAVISPMVPDAVYTFTLQDATGAPVLSNQLTCKTPKAVDFSGYGITPDRITYQLCHRPEKEKWTRWDLSDSDFTNTFKVGEEVSMLVKLSRRYAVYDDDITSLYVFRDESGKVVSYSHYTRTWDDMWYQYYCEMNIPKVPSVPGNYELTIYYNGLYTGKVDITIE